MQLALPDASGSLVIRTYFGPASSSWGELVFAASTPIEAPDLDGPLSVDAAFISDTLFDGATAKTIAHAESPTFRTFAVLADQQTFEGARPRTLVAVDRVETPGATFRFRVAELWLVTSNLALGNTSFEELARSVTNGVLPSNDMSPDLDF
jgi:hypothetical protein